MKKNRIPARSAAQVAMSKTNPAEHEEATDPAPRRVTSGPPRFDQQPGAIGSVCRHCGQSIREHVEGFCNPDDATQHFAEQELEAAQLEEMPPPPIRVRQTHREPIINERAARLISVPGQPADFGPIEPIDPQDFTPIEHQRIGVIDQALELLNILPDCPEREMLARRCALMIGGQLQILGYTVAEEQE